MVLKDIPATARPREKLLARGAASLADAELIALLLRTGRRGASVLQLAQELLDACGGMHGLLQAQPGDLLFWGPGGSDHVAMYIGGGEMIEAPYTGATVHITSVRMDFEYIGRVE